MSWPNTGVQHHCGSCSPQGDTPGLSPVWDVIGVKPPQAWIGLLGNGKYDLGRMEELHGESCDLQYVTCLCESGGVKGLGGIRALCVSFLSPDPCNTEQVNNQNKKNKSRAWGRCCTICALRCLVFKVLWKGTIVLAFLSKVERGTDAVILLKCDTEGVYSWV